MRLLSTSVHLTPMIADLAERSVVLLGEASHGTHGESWNVRNRHMMETLDRLMQFHGAGAKGIV